MTTHAWLAVGGLVLTFLLAAAAALVGFGKCKQQIDQNKKTGEDNREANLALAKEINGNLKEIHAALNNGNRELGGLTEAVNTLKHQVTDTNKKIDKTTLEVASLTAKTEGIEKKLDCQTR